MKYERECIQETYAKNLIITLNKYYSDWKVVSTFYNSNKNLYVCIVEREVK